MSEPREAFAEWWATVADTMGVPLTADEEPRAKALSKAAFTAGLAAGRGEAAKVCDERKASWLSDVEAIRRETGTRHNAVASLAMLNASESSECARAIREG